MEFNMSLVNKVFEIIEDDGYKISWWFSTKPTKAQIRNRKKWAKTYWLYNLDKLMV
ncbi:hypothetical protein CPT_Melville_067 [Salmonella phage Melville]|uniref:Uncharacterized protein n=1 Tax=Salmonella phage Melville TaxID=2041413 RepID=A0A2D1GM97_9CAUD|nr:hypothetical protein FDI73_gp067 [Salmonella phage Melville]ATN93041.1 hypothetical protein CPT_Melville_067 [Salmonella phage Melville]